jgi:sn-glycerol 3-phosphate transport system permease protein
MSPTIPLLIVAVAALLGAAVIYRSQRWRLGLGVGAAAGMVGALLFMLPLNFCPFEPERQSVDVGFGILLVLVGITLVVWPVNWVMHRLRRRQGLVSEPPRPGTFKGRWMPLLLLAPTLIILALFLYYPSLDTFSLSTLLARLGARRTAFICLDNFTRLIEPEYGQTVLRTLGISLAIVVLGMSLGLLIALAAYQPVRGARLYRTLLIWPYAISPVVAGIIFSLLFNPAGGIINHFLEQWFGFTVPWVNDPRYAPWTIILASVWKSLGFNILFYIAGLQNIPKDLLESAAIDGANAIQRFFRVTFPLLSPITFFLIVTNVTYAFFETVGTIVYLTGGAGPLDSTNTMMFRIYQLGIQNNDLGKAAAQSIVLFLLVIGVTVLQFRTTGERVNYGA